MNNNATIYKKRFFKILISILAVFFIFYIVILAFLFTRNVPYTYSATLQPGPELSQKSQDELDAEGEGFFTSPVRTNFLLVGVDKGGGLTDTIMVVSFISTTGEVNILSIPRDTYVTFTGESLTELKSANRGAPSVMKINAINSYGGEKGIELLENKLEEMLGIRIDYYVAVDLEGFRNIVDTIGGVYFDVPAGGLRYSDPTQGLYINLQGGYQLLNGKDAEGLVRFRKGYTTQDLQRAQVQQEFLKACISQILNKETLLKNIGGLAINLIKYVDTNFGLLDMPKYLNSIRKIDTENINNETLPGVAQSIDGVSYYIMDKTQAKEIVDKFFYGNTSLEDTEDEEKEENIK